MCDTFRLPVEVCQALSEEEATKFLRDQKFDLTLLNHQLKPTFSRDGDGILRRLQEDEGGKRIFKRLRGGYFPKNSASPVVGMSTSWPNEPPDCRPEENISTIIGAGDYVEIIKRNLELE